MALLRPVLRGLRGLFRPGATARDVDDEVRHFFEEAAAEHASRGLSADDAARAASRDLGTPESIREAVADHGWEARVGALGRDAAYAVRGLRRDGLFTAAALVTLACGIGTASAIVAAVTPVLFEPLPYARASRLVSVVETTPSNAARIPGTFGMFTHLASRTRTFEALAVFRSWEPVLAGDEPERLDGQRVSAGYLRVLAAAPERGRGFEAADDRAGAKAVVVLSHALWQRRFGGDPALVGREILLDERPHTVIGIMPPGFENVLAPAAALWTPLQYDLTDGRAWGHHLQTIGRLRPDVDVAAAAADVQATARSVLDTVKPETYDPATRVSAVRLKDDLVRGVKPAFAAVLAAVAVLLVIACVNVSGLLLARAAGRRRELTLRSALGASRGRLVQQLVVETLIIAALGGTAGVLVARLLVRSLVAVAPATFFRLGAVSPAGAILWTGVGLTTAIGLALGLLAAVQATRRDPHAEAAGASPRATAAARPIRGVLVGGQVALTVVLLVGSGLLLRSLGRLLAIDPGFTPAGVLSLQVQVSGRRFDAAAAASRFFDGALDAVSAVPGVEAAAFTSQLPLGGDADEYGAHFEADAMRPAATASVFRYAVSAGYFDTLGIPLRAGRVLDARDRGDTPRVALISDSLARRRFQSDSPIGARFTLGRTDGAPYTVVGVVGSVRQVTLAADEADAVYVPAAQWDTPDPVRSLVVRTAGDPGALAPAVAGAIRSVDRGQPIVRVATMPDIVLTTAAERRFVLRLFQGFALAALLLATAGLYGLLAAGVAERTREIGVRSVLGATSADILWMVLGRGLAPATVGAAVGLTLAAGGSRLIGGLLFAVSPYDAWTYGGALAVLWGAAVVACLVPAWQAVRVDPATTLRAE